MSDDITPASVMTAFWRWFGVILLALALIAALVVGGWQAGWWFTTQDVARQSNVIRNNYATQETYLQQLSKYIGNLAVIKVQEDQAGGQELADLQAEARGQGQQACQLVPQISIPLGTDAGWVAANCAGGALSPSSALIQP